MFGMLFALFLISFFQKEGNTQDVATTQNSWLGECLFGKEQLRLTYSNTSAQLKVEFTPLPAACNLTSYHIIIQSNTTELKEVPKDCHDHSFAVHSDRYISGANASVLTAVFRYIYSGVYCVEVIPKELTNSKKPHYQIAEFYTNIGAPDISRWNTTLLVETNSREKSVRTRFTNGPPQIDFERFRIYLKRVHSSCDEIENGSEKFKDTTSTDMDVLFTNVAAGNYCILVRPLDERCHPDRVWGDTKSCLRHSVTYELLPPNIAGAVVNVDCNNKQRDITILVTLLVAVVILVSGIFYYLASRTNLLIFVWPAVTEPQKVTKSETAITFDSSSKWDNCQPVPVLLLYARDNSKFLSEVDKVKKLLIKEGKCKIYDFFDEESYEDIALIGTSWITSRVADQSVRIVLISSPCAVAIQESLVRGQPQLRHGDPHPFEFMFVQGLQEVMGLIGRDGSAYDRVFLARFSDLPPLEPVLAFVSPFTLFSLPQHLVSLVKHLHGLSETDETQPLTLTSEFQQVQY